MPTGQQKPIDTRIALDANSKMHVLVRRIDTGEAPTSWAADLGDMNAILMARNAGDFARSAEGLGLMYRPCDVPATRRMGAGALRKAIGRRLASPDPTGLLRECYFDPFSQVGDATWAFEQIGQPGKAPTARAAAELDILVDNDFVRDGCEYIIEPVHDWLVLRNLMSISLRLLANSRAAAAEGTLDNVLTATGFRHIEPQSDAAQTALDGKPAYVIPVAYNPFFSRPLIDLTWNDQSIWPFFCRISETDQGEAEKLLGVVGVKHLIGAKDIRFITSVQADKAKASLKLKKEADSPEKTWLYLALIANEGGQEATANTFLRAMDSVFGTREIACGGERGTELHAPSHPTNMPEAMWALAWEHPNRYLMSCKHCGRVQFSYMLGGETAFCSPGCRSAYSKAHRSEA